MNHQKKKYAKDDVVYDFGEITLTGYWTATIKHTGLQSHLCAKYQGVVVIKKNRASKHGVLHMRPQHLSENLNFPYPRN
jgi:hypothetical protein